MSSDDAPKVVSDLPDKVLGAPIFFPKEFKDWMTDYVATNIPMIPFTSVFGAALNIAKSGSFIAASESTTSAAYADMATVGPQITNLVDGSYIFMFGAYARARAAVNYNGTTPSDDYSIRGVEGQMAMSRAQLKTVKNNNVNSAKVQYKAGAPFARRWLIALRVGAG